MLNRRSRIRGVAIPSTLTTNALDSLADTGWNLFQPVSVRPLRAPVFEPVFEPCYATVTQRLCTDLVDRAPQKSGAGMFNSAGEFADSSGNHPLSGRVAELQLLRTCLSRVESGSGTFALVSGEAGIGKSSLVHVLEDDARQGGFLVLSGGSYDLSASPPYGPWLELIDRYQPDNQLPPLPEFLSDPESLARLSTQERLHAEVLAFFTSIAETRPLLLVQEDLHWADHASLELLRLIARNCQYHRMMLIATYRDDEVTSQHDLYTLLPALVREAVPERIELRPLIRDNVDELVQRFGGIEQSEQLAVVDYLMRWAEGNPLFTVELLRSLGSDGVSERATPGHRDGIASPTVPQLIRQMVDRRLSSMPEESAVELQNAAVIGQVVPVELWEQLSSGDAMVQALEAGIESGLISERPDGRSVAFRHALVREAVYAGIGLLPRRQLHRRVAETLIDQPSADPDSVAYHLQHAGDERAAEWLIRAGEQAERRFAWPAAIERHHAATELLERSRGNEATLARLYLKLGRLMRFSDPEGGIPFHQRARAAARASGDTAIAGLALFNEGSQTCMLGNPGTGLQQMQEGIEEMLSARDDALTSQRWSQTVLPARIDPIISSLGTYVAQLSYAGRYHEAISVTEQHVDLDLDHQSRFREILDSSASFIDGFWGLGITLTALGDVRRGKFAFDLARQALAEFQHLAHRMSVTSSYLTMHHFVFSPANLEERRELVEEIETNTRISSGSIGTRNALWGYERVLYLEGHWHELRKLIEEHEPPTLAVFRNSAYAVRARLDWHQGRRDEAWKLISSILPDSGKARTQDQMLFVPREPSRIAAEIALETGDLKYARELLDDHDYWMEQSGAIIGRAESQLLRAKIHQLEGNEELAEEATHSALALASDPEQPMAQMEIYRFLGERAVKSGDLGQAKCFLDRSRSIAEAANLPFERSRTVLEQAKLHLVCDETDSARRLLDEARSTATALGAKPLLEHIDQLVGRTGRRGGSSRFGLSPRELEVLRCLSEGLTDKQIAERLFISPNTVMRHVSSILGKLDVESRTAAVAVAAREELV